MTLGGLALAVGILVDDSTVTIENTHRLLTEEHKPLPEATLYGAAGIAVPTLVSTLAIACVFTSVIFLQGPAKYLFTPLGLAVVFAMLASYGLSRTLTPIVIGLLLKGEHHDAADQAHRSWSRRFFDGFSRGFERMRTEYIALLGLLLRRRIDGADRGSLGSRAWRRHADVRRPRFLPASSMAARSNCTSAPRRHPHRIDRSNLPGGRG